MSVRAIAAVKHDSESKSTTRLFLIMLADYADDFGICWPGIETLADDCRLNERTIRRQIERLEAMNEVLAFRRRRQSTVYVLNLPSLAPLNAQAKHRLTELLGSYPQSLDRAICPRTTPFQNVQGTKRNLGDIDQSLSSLSSVDISERVSPEILKIAERMADACKYSDLDEAIEIVEDFADFLDLRVIDEAVGWTLMNDMADPPRKPSYFRPMLANWARQRGIRVSA